jgi:aryl-alcohol dehydrogenase-like predicted oxidoreductase
MVSGLWQLAGGHDENIDIGAAAQAMHPLLDAGLECFDMADHYGDAGMTSILMNFKSCALTISQSWSWESLDLHLHEI